MPIVKKEDVPQHVLNIAENVRIGAMKQAPKSKADFMVTPTCYMVITKNDAVDKVIRGKVLSLKSLSKEYMKTTAAIHTATRLIKMVSQSKADGDTEASEMQKDMMDTLNISPSDLRELLDGMLFHTMIVCECWLCVDQEYLAAKKDDPNMTQITENEYERVHQERTSSIPKEFDKGLLFHIIYDDDEGNAHHYFFMNEIVRGSDPDGTKYIKDIKHKYVYKAADGENISFSFGTEEDINKEDISTKDGVQLSRKDAHIEIEDLLKTMFMSECQIADFEDVHLCATKALLDAFQKDTIQKAQGSFDREHTLSNTVLIVSKQGDVIEFGEMMNWTATHPEAIASAVASMYGHHLGRRMAEDLGQERNPGIDPHGIVMIEELAMYPLTEEQRNNAKPTDIIKEVMVIIEIDQFSHTRFYWREIDRTTRTLGPVSEIDVEEEMFDSDHTFIKAVKQSWISAKPEIEKAKNQLQERADKFRRKHRGEESGEEISEELHQGLN